jgi:alkaline phosphatase D
MKTNSRRIFLKKFSIGFLTVPFINISPLTDWIKKTVSRKPVNASVYFTTGFKMMEVQQDSVLVWTRLCRQAVRNPVIHERREQVFRHPINFDEDQPVEKMDGGVDGAPGVVRMKLTHKREEIVSGWMTASAANDFTVKFLFKNLRKGTPYKVGIEGKPSVNDRPQVVKGKFETLPDPADVRPANFVTSTCQYFWSFDDDSRGFKTYDSMRKLKPDFYIHTGDYIYYDKPGPMATTVTKARHKWHAMDSWPSLREFYEDVPVYMIKDDHDLLKNDAYAGIPPFGQLTFEEGLKIWYENVPLHDKPYRNIRWGKDLEIWMVEGREFRSANTLPDSAQKTIWGDEQKQWFMETVEASDATFKVLFTATPVVGPDRDSKKDNHANQVFQTEGEWLRAYLSKHKGMFVVNGDRHWQYVSKDGETGLMEFGSGPVSDFHVQGWDPDDVRPEHRFLRLKGGFLNIRVDREKGRPFIQFIHRDVGGKVVHEERFG